ncbi:hypothetical protein CYLTODRAFT_430064 [Cylindrobasidium torrendii FP15055 ss-10]|uniref:Amidohydrolase-related domain-containing protein n=1 Tax=Cylindrobasidium torrendii FP15055 ss-10 TaxID=1314674 RepID=A0A0D7BKX2_9AGAR|nr:hypothetical protein CYLTODRAFT_430064 [Cylindrobasidium torrendii FP15055 ss-10]
MKTPSSPSLPFNPADTVLLIAGKLFDSEKLEFLERQGVLISRRTGLILKVFPYTDEASNQYETIDLSHLTVLPGFVDVHVHLFVHSYAEASWNDQITKESLAERVVRATVHAKKTLMAGYTTVRDLGTEGAGDADVGLRKCLAGPNPIIPGPRYFIANRAIVAPGSYGPKSSLHVNQEGVDGNIAAQVAGGVDACVQAVRQQISAGADWIKVNYRTRSRVSDVSTYISDTSTTSFTQAEVHAMLDIASQHGVKVAMHAHNASAAAPYAGLVDSVEHSPGREALQYNGTKTVWVPTLAAYYITAQRGEMPQRWERMRETFLEALALGMDNIACGGDTEMKLMRRLGADYRKVLQWGTLGGWKCVRPKHWKETGGRGGDNERYFGAVKSGWAADIIAVEGDLETDFEGTIDRVQFVMRGGKVYKANGKFVEDNIGNVYLGPPPRTGGTGWASPRP